MDLDELFENLETEFEALEHTEQPQGIEKLSTTVGGNRLTLERPILGKSFVAGVISGRAIWRFQPHRTLAVAKITFGQSDSSQFESLDPAELLHQSLIGRFVRYSLAGDGQQIRRGRVLQLMQGLLLFESTGQVLAVAVDRLAWLEVHAADN